MKNYILRIVLFIIIPVISCDAKAAVSFEETTYDFGEVSQESVISHTFNFKNIGTETLVIERIKAG